MPSAKGSSRGLGAVVLCGGTSSRMGRPKAWLPFPTAGGGEETLLARVVRRISPAATVVVVAGPEQDVPPLPPGTLLARDPDPNRGPLVGTLVGLRALGDLVDEAFVTSTDAPFVGAALVRRLAALGGDDWDAVAPRIDGRWQPLSAVYRLAVAPTIERLLADGVQRATSLLDEVRTLAVDRATLLADPALAEEDPDLLGLTNVNTPEAYADALRLVRAGEPW